MARTSSGVLALCLLALLAGHVLAHEAVVLRIAGDNAPAAYVSMQTATFYAGTNNQVLTRYGAQGAVNSKALFASNLVDCIVSDVPLTVVEQSTAESTYRTLVAHFPIAVSGLAIVYNRANVNGGAPLNLSPSVLAGIFSGSITNWDDSAITALNPGFVSNGNNNQITPIVLDNGGSTWVLTSYLKQFASWAGISYTITPQSNNGNFIHATSASALLAAVSSTPGSISYINYDEAAATGLSTAALSPTSTNPTTFVQPSLASIGAAQSAQTVATLPSTGAGTSWDTGLLFNAPNASAYPISLFIHVITLTDLQPTGENGVALGALLKWWLSPSAISATASKSLVGISPLVVAINNNTLENFNYFSGLSTTQYYPFVAPAAPVAPAPVPVAAPTLTEIPSTPLQIVIIISLLLLIGLVIAYDNYRGGCIIKCQQSGRGIWA